VPFADDVDRRATWPRGGSARVVRDAERQRDDPHDLVQRWMGESLGERLRLLFRVSSLEWSDRDGEEDDTRCCLTGSER